MPAFALFPYTNRQLGLQEMLTPKESCMEFAMLAMIFLANLKVNDRFSLDRHDFHVSHIDDHRIQFSCGLQLNAEELSSAPLHAQLVCALKQCPPAYSNKLCKILERDPAVYRLRTQQGWVVNDALCLMTGNIQYPSCDDIATLEQPKEIIHAPQTIHILPSPPVSPEPEKIPVSNRAEPQLSLF